MYHLPIKTSIFVIPKNILKDLLSDLDGQIPTFKLNQKAWNEDWTILFKCWNFCGYLWYGLISPLKKKHLQNWSWHLREMAEWQRRAHRIKCNLKVVSLRQNLELIRSLFSLSIFFWIHVFIHTLQDNYISC